MSLSSYIRNATPKPHLHNNPFEAAPGTPVAKLVVRPSFREMTPESSSARTAVNALNASNKREGERQSESAGAGAGELKTTARRALAFGASPRGNAGTVAGWHLWVAPSAPTHPRSHAPTLPRTHSHTCRFPALHTQSCILCRAIVRCCVWCMRGSFIMLARNGNTLSCLCVCVCVWCFSCLPRTCSAAARVDGWAHVQLRHVSREVIADTHVWIVGMCEIKKSFHVSHS